MTLLHRRYLVASFLSVMLLLSNLVSAQYEDKIGVTLPSPNNIFSASYLNANVNLYTGVPDVHLPIYTLESKELSIPIVLSYKASGVRLQDVASYVGMNWGLKAGGLITRTVRGLPDESEKGYIGKNKTGIEINTGAESSQARADKIAKGEWDGEPDLFYITTPTQQLSFVFDENGTAVFTQPTRVTVRFERTNTIDDNLNIVWYVTDENGTEYIYGATANARETVDGPPEFVSTWYLSSIKSFNGTDQITYEYTAGPNISTKIYNKVRLRFSTSGNCTGPAEYVSISDNARIYKAPKYISSITSATTTIKFIYANNRKDLADGYRLSTIGIYSVADATFLKGFLFQHDYFHPVDTNMDLNRLCLKNIYAISKDKTSLRLYDFKYYVDPLLKFPLRSSVAFDHWGFYNNNSESTPFTPEANKQPDFSKTVQYSLQSIEHAQGGKTEFQYELNSYYDNLSNSDKNSGGLRIKAIKEYDNIGNVYTKSYEYKLPNNYSSGQQFMKNMIYNKSTTILYPHPTNPCTITGESINAGILFTLADVNGVLIGYSRVKEINVNGGYEVSTFSNFSDFPDVFTIINSKNGAVSSIETMRQIGYPTSYAYKRGLIRTREVYTASHQKISDVSYDYQVISPMVKKARGINLSLSYTLSGTEIANWYQNVYYQPTESYNIKKETERIYDAENVTAYMQKTKEYEYNPNGTLVRRIVYNTSEGTSYYDKFYYPENKAELLDLSIDENKACGYMGLMTNPIREERHWPDNSIDIKDTRYQVQGPATSPRVFPYKVLSKRNGAPFSEDATYTYDYTTGNLITETAKDGRVNGYLWSNDNSLMAKSLKAMGNEIYYQSFEYMPNAITGTAFSGRKYYSGAYQIPFVRPNAKAYQLSYRRLVSNVWQPVTVNYTVDNMTLNEPYPIDDIRIRPVGARLNTYTHLPLNGINSASDDNGVIQYYEYDGFQRLKLIRDLNGNIIKQLDYKYAIDDPLPKINISIVLRNYYVEEDTPTYYLEKIEAWLVLKDENGNLVNNPGFAINYSITEERQDGTTTTNHSVFFNNAEHPIYAGTLSEWTRNSQGTLLQYRNTSFNVLQGIGY